MLIEHGVNDLARSEHVRRKVREGGAEGVLICLADACQQSGGEGAAGEAVLVVLGYGHAVDIDDSRRGIVGVSLGHVEGWAIAINRGLAGGHINGVGKVCRHSLPFCVCYHEGEGARDVMHGAYASGVGFHVFGPFFQVVTRVINEGWGDVVCRGRHGNGWVDGWVGGWMDGC
jgi:hypothetical protein